MVPLITTIAACTCYAPFPSFDVKYIHVLLRKNHRYILVNTRNDTKIFLKYMFMLKPKQLFIIINVNVCTKQTIKSRSLTEKFWKVHFPSHDWVFDDRIRHLNHLRSLIVLSSKVNNLPFWKVEFSQERRCHDSVKMTVNERWVWFRLEWLTRQLQSTLMCLE
jgi:hypothetical protein